MWLINKNADSVKQYYAAISGGVTIDETKISAFNGGDIMSVVGSTAGISVTGILTNAPDWIASFFGGGNTVYSDIREAIVMANADPAIDNIVMNIDSPGGHAGAELKETMDFIANSSKPINAFVGYQAASAAYGIASQATFISAQNKSTILGSVGVVQMFFVDEQIVEISSSDSPNKRPDVTTEEGKSIVRAELDQMHEVFAEDIAAGRGVSVATVNSDFGRGGIFLAEKAVKRGMIDSIGSASQTADGGTTTEAIKMDLKTLKADHLDLYQSVLDEGINKGVAQGAESEKKRAAAHLKMGATCGDMAIATKAIADGAAFNDDEVQADYLSASMNKRDKQDREDDNAPAENITGDAENQNGEDPMLEHCLKAVNG